MIQLPIFAINGSAEQPRQPEVLSQKVTVEISDGTSQAKKHFNPRDLSALSIFHQSGILNQMNNRSREIGNEKRVTKVAPVMLSKNGTALALYFLDFLSEHKLVEMLESGSILFQDPPLTHLDPCLKILIFSQFKGRSKSGQESPTRV